MKKMKKMKKIKKKFCMIISIASITPTITMGGIVDVLATNLSNTQSIQITYNVSINVNERISITEDEKKVYILERKDVMDATKDDYEQTFIKMYEQEQK